MKLSLNQLTDGASNTLAFTEDLVKGGVKVGADVLKAGIDLVSKPISPILDKFPGNLIDIIKLPLPFPKPTPEFESNYEGLIDAVNTLSDQINDKKAQLEDPNLTPEQRMQLAIELQELMQMRLQMITMTTNLLKTEHDSNMAVTNNLRV